MVYRFSFFVGGVIAETAFFQNFTGLSEGVGDLAGSVGITSDGDNLAAKFPVAFQNGGAGVGFPKTLCQPGRSEEHTSELQSQR